MNGGKTSLKLKCLVLAATIATLAAPAVQAKAAIRVGGPATTGQTTDSSLATSSDPGRDRLGSEHADASYFWTEAGIVAGVLAGFFVLGLWGDVAIGGLILGFCVLGAGAARTLRQAGACALGLLRSTTRQLRSAHPWPLRARGQHEL